jgi:DNA (cytosine-5)-methyltransferase 1
MKRMPTAIDLFCGAGGVTEGLRQAGYRVVGAVDVDPLACATYRLNHGRVKLWETAISGISGRLMLKNLRLKPGALDLLTACPPCQGFSRMRTKNGKRENRDPRNGLILEVLRIVRSTKPKAIMLENVPGLAKSAKFTAFREGLRKLGYQITWAVVDAAHFGVPQRRRRLILMASKLGVPEFAARSAVQKTVRQSIGSLPAPRSSRDPLHNYKVHRGKAVKDLIRKIPRNGGSRAALGKAHQLRCHRRATGFKDVYGRMAWDKPAPTITGGCINPSKGRFLHPGAHRAITLREAALLQTFPKSYQFSLTQGRYAAAVLIGNALPPEFIRRQATQLLKTKKEADRRDPALG